MPALATSRMRDAGNASIVGRIMFGSEGEPDYPVNAISVWARESGPRAALTIPEGKAGCLRAMRHRWPTDHDVERGRVRRASGPHRHPRAADCYGMLVRSTRLAAQMH